MTSCATCPKDFSTLAHMRRTLSTGGAVLEAARNGIDASMHAWIDAQTDPGKMSEALALLAGEDLEQALDPSEAGNTSHPLSRLASLVEPGAAPVPVRSALIRFAPTPVMSRLFELGFTIETNSITAAEIWLLHGDAIGKDIFRTHFPRKSPAVIYWEHKGLVLPSGRLCDDGVRLVAKEIRRMKRLPPRIESAHRKTVRTDWPIALSFIRINGWHPEGFAGPQTGVVSGARLKRIHEMFRKKDSAHAEITRKVRLDCMPPIEDILRMSPDRETLDALLDSLDAAVAAPAQEIACAPGA